jgi:hypothetical protein
MSIVGHSNAAPTTATGIRSAVHDYHKKSPSSYLAGAM